MQTNRTRLPGNGALRRCENELRLRRAAEREGERLHGLRDEPVEGERSAFVGDLDQAGLTQNLQVVRDRRLREAERVELAGAGVALAREAIDDREPRRIRERLEPRRETLELLRLERGRPGGAAGDCGDLLH